MTTTMSYRIDISVITRAALAVREAFTTYNKWCKKCDDPTLVADIFKAEARFDALANVLRITPAQLWQVIRTCEKCGVKMNRRNFRLQSFVEVRKSIHEEVIFRTAFENAVKNGKKGKSVI